MTMKVNFGSKFTLLCAAALLLLQGCSSSFDKKYNDSLLRANSPGLKNLEQQKQRAFTRYSNAFLGKQVVYSAKQQQLLAKPVVFRSEIPMSLDQVLSAIAEQTKSSFRINDQIPGGAGKAAQADGGGSPVKEQSVNFSGTFEEFMRYLSALYDVSVSLEDDNILLVTVYKTYALKLDYFGANDYESGLDISSNEAASGGVKGKTDVKFQTTFWEDVTSMAQKYISSGVYNIFKDVGVLTFSGRPSEYQVLSHILNDYKKSNSKQFVITYKVFTLDKTKTSNLGAGFAQNFIKGGTSFSFSALGTGTSVLNFGRTFSEGSSVSARLNALYELTGKKLLQSGTMVTRNNTPAPMNLTQTQNFISEKTTNRNIQLGDETAIKTSSITTGTSVILTPRVLSDGRVQVTSAFTSKTLNNPDIFDTNKANNAEQIQLPNVSSTELFSTVDVTPGSLIVVGQYEEKSSGDTRSLGIISGRLDREDNTNTVVMVIGIDYYDKPFGADQ